MPCTLVPCQPQALARLPPLAPPVAAWVRLFDRAEAAMYPDDSDELGEPSKYTQRAASSLWDAVYQAGHTLTATERIHARAYLWLRDSTASLPTRDERAAMGWALCPCTHCRYGRLIGETRQQLVDCAPEAQRQYARVATAHLSPAYRTTHAAHEARSA